MDPPLPSRHFTVDKLRLLRDNSGMKNHSDRDMLQSMIDALPFLVFLVDEDVRIQDYNKTAADFLLAERSSILHKRGGEVLHCIHAEDSPDGCGHGPFCPQCVVRNSVTEAFRGKQVVRRRTRLELKKGDDQLDIYALVTASPFHFHKTLLASLLIEDISDIVSVSRLIPICSVCKKVRDENEDWSRVEKYFKDHWDIEFSHGLCPKCYEEECRSLNPAPSR